MHDERRRDRGARRARPRPAHQARDLRGHRALEVEAWQAPDEPVPFAEAAGRGRTRRSQVDTPWGPPWAPPGCADARHGAPPSGPGGASRPSSTSASSATGPATRPRPWSTDRRDAAQGRQPAEPVRPGRQPGDAAASRSDYLRRGRRQPRHPGERLRPDARWATCSPPGTSRSTASPRADLAVLDEDVWHLRLDIEVLRELMRRAAADDPRRHEILRALERSPGRPRPRRRRRHRGRAPAPSWPRCWPARPRQRRTPSRPSATRTSTRAWLWPIRETKRKCARTFANVTALADDYPEFVFACSQAQQYAWIKEHYPEVFERIQEAVADGPVGAGRRHVGRGRRQPARRRGAGPPARPRQAVLPRASSASRPRTSGCPTPSATPRASRSSPSSPASSGSSPRRSPGTRPTSSRTTPSGGRASTAPGSSPTSRRSTPTTRSSRGAELAHAVRNFAEKGAATRSLLPFGYGDGGGGPTREMLERARRLARPRGLARGRDRAPRRLLRRGPGRVPRRARSGRASSTWSCTAAPTPARPGPSRATGAASTCCARPSCGRRPPPCTRRATPTRTRSSTGCGRRCCCTSSTTSCPARRSPGCTARPRPPTRGSRAELEAIIAAAAAALAGRRRGRRVLNTSPVDRAEVVTVRTAAEPVRRWPTARRRRAAVPGSARPLGAPPTPAHRRRDRAATATSSTTACSGWRSTRDGLLASRASTWPPAARCSPPAPAATCSSCTPTCPNQWDAWDIDRHYRRQLHRPRSTPTSVERRRARAAASAAVRVDAVLRRARRIAQTSRCAAGSRRHRLRHRDRLARAGEVAQGRLPARRARRPLRRRDPVRPRPPAHPHQHQLGRGPVRGLRATAGSTSASPATASPSLNDSTYGHDVARTTRAGRRHHHDRPAHPAARPARPRPRGRPGQRTASPTRCCPGASVGDAVARGLRAQPAAAGGVRRDAATRPRRWSAWTARPSWSRRSSSPTTARATCRPALRVARRTGAARLLPAFPRRPAPR